MYAFRSAQGDHLRKEQVGEGGGAATVYISTQNLGEETDDLLYIILILWASLNDIDQD